MDDAAPDLEEALRLAASPDYQDRVAAAALLSVIAEQSAPARTLRALLLDPWDTAVTEAAARELTARRDELGLSLIASCLTEADGQQMDWIESGVTESLDSDETRAWAIATAGRLRAVDGEGAQRLLTILERAGRR